MVVKNGMYYVLYFQDNAIAIHGIGSTFKLSHPCLIFFRFLLHICPSLRPKGMTLTALAKEMIQAGVKYAVNMDGGGSTVLAHHHNVISHPTCLDIPIRCERKVATMFCIQQENGRFGTTSQV